MTIEPSRRQESFKTAVLVSFFVSGIVGLIYEVVWMKVLTLVIGNTVFSVSTVLSVFMGGLALGSWLAGRWIDKAENPVRIYGVLELGIGLYGFLLPVIIHLTEPLFRVIHQSFYPSFHVFSFLKFAVCSLILLIPTVLMGATLPVLSRHFADRYERIGSLIGKLYSVNTFGAVIGALGAGFVLVPLMGIRSTLFLAAATNILIGVFVIWISRGTTAPLAGTEPAAEGKKNVVLKLVLAGFALSGFAALVYEVAWTRTFSLAIGSSVYAFSLILAAFIGGLALGASVFSRFVDKAKDPILSLALIQVGVGISSALIASLLGHLPPFMARLISGLASSFWLLQTAQFALLFVLILVPTVFMGAAFPFVIKIFTTKLNEVGRSIGEVYASNTVGAIFGSFSAGFLWIPLLGLENTIALAVSVNLLLGVLFFFLSPSLSRHKRLLFAGTAVCFLVAGFAMPSWDRVLLTSGPYAYAFSYEKQAENANIALVEAMTNSELIFHKDGAGATVTVRRHADGNISLQMNGKTDASSRGDLETELFMAHIPLLLHRDPRDVLVVGLASGITLGSTLLHPARRVDCVEISPEVVEASRYFDDHNHRPLEDERVRLIVDDARSHLSMNDQRYDVIISQPSNLWVSGMANLFTEEYYSLCKRRLNEGGILCAWVHGYKLASDDFKVVLNTFLRVFPHVSLWEASDSVDYLLVGSETPVKRDFESVSRRFERVRDDLGRVKIKNVFGLLGHFVAVEDELERFVRGSFVNTDDRNRLEFSSPKFRHEETLPSLVSGLNYHQSTVLSQLSNVGFEERKSVENVFQARRHLTKGLLYLDERNEVQAAEELKKALEREPGQPAAQKHLDKLKTAVFEAARRSETSGRPEEAIKGYLLAIEIDPRLTHAYLNLANIFDNKGHVHEAMELYRKALALAPESAVVRMDLGVAYARQKKFDLAKAEWKRVLKIDPDNPKAREYLRRLEE